MNTTILITLIICASILSLAAIICDHLYEKMSIDNKTDCPTKKIVKIHRNYIVGILGFSIIMMLTSRYGGPNNAIFDYLSFGSTITSLVLSILAIFVTVESSSDLNKQFGKIDDITRSITSVSNDINTSIKCLNESEEKLRKATIEIVSQIGGMTDNIVEKVSNKNKEFFDQLNANIHQPKETDLSGSSVQNYINGIQDLFLTNTSPNGLLALYACSLSCENKKEFELIHLFAKNEMYVFGFLIACASMNLISIEHDNLNNKIKCTKTYFDQSKIKIKIQNYIEKLTATPDMGPDYCKNFELINAYFEVK